MTLAQWLFHYMEIARARRIDIKPQLQKLSDIEVSLQSFYLLIDKDNGLKLIESIGKARSEEQANSKGKKPKQQEQQKTTNNSGEEEYEDILTDEDKELWAFMQQQPTKMKETREMKNTGKFLLPTRSKQDLIDGQFKVVDSAKDVKKPKLGFNKQ